jgi:NAD(P)H-flavin reductase
VVTRFLGRAEVDAANAIAMICGPEIMMRFAASELIYKGLPGEQIFVALERNMNCGTAFCGHCQLGPYFVCRDGPVFRFSDVEPFITVEQF